MWLSSSQSDGRSKTRDDYRVPNFKFVPSGTRFGIGIPANEKDLSSLKKKSLEG
jgi:hypothetical protein